MLTNLRAYELTNSAASHPPTLLASKLLSALHFPTSQLLNLLAPQLPNFRVFQLPSFSFARLQKIIPQILRIRIGIKTPAGLDPQITAFNFAFEGLRGMIFGIL